jgi:hypothetical protein
MPDHERPETVCVVMLDPDAPAWRPYQVKMVCMTPLEYDTYLRNKGQKEQQSPETFLSDIDTNL